MSKIYFGHFLFLIIFLKLQISQNGGAMEKLVAYKGKEPFLFISYAHKNFDEVHGVISKLNQLGLHIWYDEGIDPGNEWPEEIARAIDRSSLFVVFVTKDAMASRNVISECYYALDHNKPFLAVFLEDVPFSPGLALRASSTQAIMKFRMSDQDFYAKMVQTIEFKLPDVLIDDSTSVRLDRENSRKNQKKSVKLRFKKEIVLGVIFVAFFLFVGFTAKSIGNLNQMIDQIKESSTGELASVSTEAPITEVEDMTEATIDETLTYSTEAVIQVITREAFGKTSFNGIQYYNGQEIVNSKDGIYITFYKENLYTLWVDRNEVIDKLKNFTFASVSSFDDAANTNEFEIWAKSDAGVHYYEDSYGYGIGAIEGYPHCVVFLYDNNKVLLDIIEFKNYQE